LHMKRISVKDKRGGMRDNSGNKHKGQKRREGKGCRSWKNKACIEKKTSGVREKKTAGRDLKVSKGRNETPGMAGLPGRSWGGEKGHQMKIRRVPVRTQADHGLGGGDWRA